MSVSIVFSSLCFVAKILFKIFSFVIGFIYKSITTEEIIVESNTEVQTEEKNEEEDVNEPYCNITNEVLFKILTKVLEKQDNIEKKLNTLQQQQKQLFHSNKLTEQKNFNVPTLQNQNVKNIPKKNIQNKNVPVVNAKQ